MKPLQSDWGSLRDLLSRAGDRADRALRGADVSVALNDLVRGTSLGGRLGELRGRSVLISTRDQLTAALALIELDGVARRLILCPPDLPLEHVASVLANAAVDAVVSNQEPAETGAASIGCFVNFSGKIAPADAMPSERCQTEWILLTSGTTGQPKLVLHTLSSLTGAIKIGQAAGSPVVWSTFYDIRRYGGLQIFLRAILGGGSLVLSKAGEATADFLTRAGLYGVTHITGTPSHWRRALMSPAAHKISPQYVRLSGEIADQTILNNLQACYPAAKVAHAFASTEAGVGFDVGDGLAGFPASLIGRAGAEVEMKVEDGTLRIRSPRTGIRYLSDNGAVFANAEGFVDTGDIVEQRGDRYVFVGRKGGIINVGGLKVHPEEVEAVINHHPSVQMSLVRSRKSPITGAVVVADVVVKAESDMGDSAGGMQLLKSEILEACRRALPPHKVPTIIRFVPSLQVSASGKLARLDA